MARREDQGAEGRLPRIGVIRKFDEAAGVDAYRGRARTPESEPSRRSEERESPSEPGPDERPDRS